MHSLRFVSAGRIALAAAVLTALSCKSDSATSPTATATVAAIVPALTKVNVAFAPGAIQMGQGGLVFASGVDQNGVAIPFVGAVTWSSSSATTATVTSTGIVTGVAVGTATITATVDGKSGTTTVTVVNSPGVTINEVESNGGVPGDWVELYNPTSAPINIGGWGFRDNDATHTIYKIPTGTTIAAGGYFMLEEADFGFGLGGADDATLYNSFGAVVELYRWTAHAATTYARCPTGTGPFITSTSSTKGAANDCSLTVKINEVESSGGTPGDWVELVNYGQTPVAIGGFTVRASDDARSYTIPAGTTINAGAFFIIDQSSLGYDLGASDAVRVFTGTTLVDSYTWTTHAAITYGRCPDGTGAFISTVAPTKGTANQCGTVTALTWPGSDDVATADGVSVFGGNLSGLMYEAPVGTSPAVLWGARNGPGSIFRLIFSGGIWTPDPTNGWQAGKLLKYPDGTGEPDTEDITFAGTGSAAGLFTVAERNNSNNGVSRNSILRWDPSGTATSLTATNEWNLTADLPVTGANLGLEGITWVPDTYLVSKGFIDEAANKVYNPADYPTHGTGIFFVGVEGTGNIYAYALNLGGSTFTRVATIVTGYTAGIMAVNFDRELNYLWGVCDDGCGGQLGIFEINTTAGSPLAGKFALTRLFNRPSTMPNINNEGFAFGPQSTCVNGLKPAFWADDSETGGHAIRTARIPCTAFTVLQAVNFGRLKP